MFLFYQHDVYAGNVQIVLLKLNPHPPPKTQNPEERTKLLGNEIKLPTFNASHFLQLTPKFPKSIWVSQNSELFQRDVRVRRVVAL